VSDDRADEQVSDRVVEVVRAVLAPLIEIDGGEIELLAVKDGVAEITLRGACAGCPGQSFTAREIVLPALRAADPRIVSVKVTVAV
jgi:Fe-S cluster biogenesis protein NfuA